MLEEEIQRHLNIELNWEGYHGSQRHWEYYEIPIIHNGYFIRIERFFRLTTHNPPADVFKYVPPFITCLHCGERSLSDRHIPYLIEVFKRTTNLKLLLLYENQFVDVRALMENLPPSLIDLRLYDNRIRKISLTPFCRQLELNLEHNHLLKYTFPREQVGVIGYNSRLYNNYFDHFFPFEFRSDMYRGIYGRHHKIYALLKNIHFAETAVRFVLRNCNVSRQLPQDGLVRGKIIQYLLGMYEWELLHLHPLHYYGIQRGV